jgi:hypothetical protein
MEKDWVFTQGSLVELKSWNNSQLHNTSYYSLSLFLYFLLVFLLGFLVFWGDIFLVFSPFFFYSFPLSFSSFTD